VLLLHVLDLALDGVGCQHHPPPGRALPPGRGPPVPVVQEAGWAPGVGLGTEPRRKIVCPFRVSNPGSPVCSQSRIF
jgi:hypothetical protein